MLLDVPYVEKSIADFDTKSTQIRAWLKSAHKITSPKSSGQIARAVEACGQKILFHTDRGAPQFDKDALKFYADHGENTAVRQLAQYIRAVRHIEDIRDRYSAKFLELRDANDIIHCNVNVMGARTGRMSVSDPALQQLPRDDKVIRGSFIPRPTSTRSKPASWPTSPRTPASSPPSPKQTPPAPTSSPSSPAPSTATTPSSRTTPGAS
jgi:DNA polymerase-1